MTPDNIFSATTRLPAVAGSFYPSDQLALRQQLSTFLVSPARSCGALASAPKALIVPHAGYIYSGGTAGEAYALLTPWADAIKRVVLLGPTHRVPVRGLAITSMQCFATPLGEVVVDQDARNRLAKLPQVVVSDAAHAQEHSLEVQLPFLQCVLGSNFTLVPLAVGDASVEEVAEVLEVLWGGAETLVVISSDLSHFHPYEEARRIDAATASHILALEPLSSFEQACGALPINGLLTVARRRGLHLEKVAQCTSGDTAGDKLRVVGYASFALYEPKHDDDHSARLGRTLLALARQAIGHQFGETDACAASGDSVAELDQPGASFVTLTLDGQLRGCIGSLEAHRSLADDVRANAVAAALRDPRFPSLSEVEFKRVRIEVSLLSAPVALQFTDEADALSQLRAGFDGVIFSTNGRRSTFLPQVWEQLPTPQLFMAHLKQKAGFPANWWSHEVSLSRYEVRKWKE